MKAKEFFRNKNLYLRYIPMSLAAMCILFFAVKNAIYPPVPENFNLALHIFKTLPTLVTLVVQIMLMSANKYAFLLGGINAATYGIVYVLTDIPFSAVNALLISFPLQIYSFFNWSKSSRGKKEVELRWIPLKYKFLVLIITAALWAFSYFVLNKNGILPSQIPELDTISFSIGLMVSVLAAFRYIDPQYMNIVACAVQLAMWIVLTIKDPSSNISHLIITVYNLYCVAQIAISWTFIYNKNKTAKIEN